MDGWLMNLSDRWTHRLHRDEKSWVGDPTVFVDMGRLMPDGSPALLKIRQHLRRGDGEVLMETMLRSGFERVPPAWGADAEF